MFLNKFKKDKFYFFNDLIHLLNNINNNDVKKVLSHIKMDKNYLNLDQVFLSRAFDDRLYTFCLFFCWSMIYFYMLIGCGQKKLTMELSLKIIY